MIRKLLAKNKGNDTGRIKWRSHEPTRIEAFSDAVFAFALSLLVFSLEVPKNSEELLNGMRALLPFAFCFAIIFMIWYAQYKFFRHYGMHDIVTIILNAILLVTILFYMYPLKFIVTGWLLPSGGTIMRREDVLPLIIIYNGGFTFIYLLFTLMYYNSYVNSAALRLTPVELFETETYIYNNLALTCIGAVIIIAAIIFHQINPALTFACFMFYSLPGPVFGIMRKRREKLFRKKFGNVPVVGPELGSES